jgi:hypothetical protein
VPLIQVMCGGQRSLLKKKLQVCESQKYCLFVGDQILIFHHNLQINHKKSYNVIFWIFLSHFVCHSWSVPMMKITGLLSGRTCTIGGWLNIFLPQCMCTQVALCWNNECQSEMHRVPFLQSLVWFSWGSISQPINLRADTYHKTTNLVYTTCHNVKPKFTNSGFMVSWFYHRCR